MHGANQRSTSGQVVRTNLRCPHCFEEIGRAAPMMVMVEGAKQAHCPSCGKVYP